VPSGSTGERETVNHRFTVSASRRHLSWLVAPSISTPSPPARRLRARSGSNRRRGVLARSLRQSAGCSRVRPPDRRMAGVRHEPSAFPPQRPQARARSSHKPRSAHVRFRCGCESVHTAVPRRGHADRSRCRGGFPDASTGNAVLYDADDEQRHREDQAQGRWQMA
jgi:hypothetical protein